MNFIIFLYSIILFFCTSGIKSEPSTQVPTTTPISNSIAITELNEFENISIKDVLSIRSEAEINEKIERRFTDIIYDFSSSCLSYKYELSTRSYSFPKKDIRINAGDRIISFNNITVSDWNDNTKGYYIGNSTELDCDSTTSTIEVALPSNIQIFATVQSINQSNFAEEGSVSMVLKNTLIKYQFASLPDGINFKSGAGSVSSYNFNISETRVEADSKFQAVVYNKLDTFLNEMESSLKEYFLQQLRDKMNKANISLATACSKLISPKVPIDIANSPVSNPILDNLYIISNASQKTWNNVILNGGPILIEGLSNLKSAKFVIHESHDNDQQYVDGRKYDSIHKKELIVEIKTNSLKGKLEWNSDFEETDTNNHTKISFFIDYIQFRYSYFVHDYIRDRQVYRSSPGFGTEFTNFIKLNVSLGKIQTKILSSSSCNSTNLVENFVSKYLKSVISEKIKNAIVGQISNKPSYSDCVYGL